MNDEEKRTLEREAKHGDAAAARRLLEVKLREGGPGQFLGERGAELLAAGPIAASIPYRDGCGAYVRYLGTPTHSGAWICPVCGCAHPYVFWSMKSEPSGARAWSASEVVLEIAADACPFCGQQTSAYVDKPPTPQKTEGPRLTETLEAYSGITGPVADASEKVECLCQRRRRILADDLKQLEAKVAMWRRDVAHFEARAVAPGASEKEAQEARATADKARAEVAVDLLRLEELKHRLAEDR